MPPSTISSGPDVGISAHTSVLIGRPQQRSAPHDVASRKKITWPLVSAVNVINL